MNPLKYVLGKATDHAVGAIVTALGGVLVVYLTPLWEYIKLAWSWLSTPVQIPMGFVILPVLVIVLVALGLIRSLMIKRRTPKPPAWMSYREDEFEGAIWRWDYDGNGQVENLLPYCKTCDYGLDARPFGLGHPVEMYCAECNYSYSAFSIDVSPESMGSNVVRRIDRNLRRNYKEGKNG